MGEYPRKKGPQGEKRILVGRFPERNFIRMRRYPRKKDHVLCKPPLRAWEEIQTKRDHAPT